MEMRRDRNMYNGSQLRPVKQAHARTTSNWNVFRNYKSNLSFSDSFSFRKSPRKKKKTEEADSSLHLNSAFSFSKSCEATKENVEGCGVLKTNSKDECPDLIFDKENDDLIFEGLTAVMKKAILDNPKVLEFITKVLPTYPGLATIMLPNQVIALYGSWSVIKQARQQLLNLSGLHEQDVSEPSHKDNKSSSLFKDDSPPILSPQKNTKNPNNGPDTVNPLKSPKDDEVRNCTISSSSSSTVAAADSSSSHNKKNRDDMTMDPIRILSSDSDISLPSPNEDPAEEDELDISAVVFHTSPLKRTGQIPFTSSVNGSADSDTDSETHSATSSQAMTSRPKRTCKVSKASSSGESSEEEEEGGSQVERMDKRRSRNKGVHHHLMKKRRGFATWYGKSIRGRRPEKKASKFQNSHHTNRLLSKQPGRIFTAKRHDSGGGGSKVVDDDDDDDGGGGDDDDDDDDDDEEEEELEEEEEVIVDVVNDDDVEEGDDWATCAAASCSLKDRGDVTDIVWLQCESCDTWWHCLCARLGDLTEDEASSLDFTCTYCSAPKTRQSAKRNKVS